MNIFKKIFGNSGKQTYKPTENNFDIEKLLCSDDVNNSIIEIDNKIGELCDYGENIDVLTEAPKIFYLIQNLEREVNNGGFKQYFYNSSGNFSNETILSLNKIGANKTANILEKAIEEFPNKIISTNRDDRISIINQIEEKSQDVWAELEQEFFKYEDNLNLLNIEFIRKNKTEFISL